MHLCFVRNVQDCGFLQRRCRVETMAQSLSAALLNQVSVRQVNLEGTVHQHASLFTRTHCIALPAEERDIRLAVFGYDSQPASLTSLTELTVWRVRTAHACSELSRKVGESVQGSNQVDAADMFCNFSDTIRVAVFRNVTAPSARITRAVISRSCFLALRGLSVVIAFTTIFANVFVFPFGSACILSSLALASGRECFDFHRHWLASIPHFRSLSIALNNSFCQHAFASNRFGLQVQMLLHNKRCYRGQDGDKHTFIQSLASCTGAPLNVLLPNKILLPRRQTKRESGIEHFCKRPIERVAHFGSYVDTFCRYASCPLPSSLSARSQHFQDLTFHHRHQDVKQLRGSSLSLTCMSHDWHWLKFLSSLFHFAVHLLRHHRNPALIMECHDGQSASIQRTRRACPWPLCQATLPLASLPQAPASRFTRTIRSRFWFAHLDAICRVSIPVASLLPDTRTKDSHHDALCRVPIPENLNAPLPF